MAAFLYRKANAPHGIGPVYAVSEVGATELLAVFWFLDDSEKAGLSSHSPLKSADFSKDLQEAEQGISPILDKTVGQMEEYFRGERKKFSVDFSLYGTEFQQAAWRVLINIPYGETISYKTQADRTGGPEKARAVGMANRLNALPVIVPCHRVIGSDGSLTGFAGKKGLGIKQLLLDLEQNFQ